MLFKVGDKVLIASGGYGIQGCRTGDVATIVSVIPKDDGGGVYYGYYVRGLPGTEAFQEYPQGLYFCPDELILESREKKASETMIDANGKFFATKSGWVVGPLEPKPYYEDIIFSSGKLLFNAENLNCINQFTHNLIPEPVDVGSPVQKDTMELGDCVLIQNQLYWVTRKEYGEVLVQNSYETLWLDQKRIVTTYPKLSVEKLEEHSYTSLVEKWVWVKAKGEYYKVKSLDFTFLNPKEGFSVSLRAHAPGTYWLNSYKLSDFDLTKVSDTHPREATMVRGFQGEGKYEYAQDSDGNYLLLAETSYHLDYYLLNLKNSRLEQFHLGSDSSFWWEYQAYRTDTLPFTLPFEYKLCLESFETVAHDGFGQFLIWVRDNAPEGLTQAILSRAKMATNTRGNIALYLNSNQMKAGKIQSLRPGRALRALLPNIKDADLEKLVDKFRRDFPTGDYTVHRSFEAADFKRAYSGGIANMQNPCTTSARKSLANSCMRHDFSHLKHHPAEAYASGEFEVLWTETPEGKIGSRLVVWHPPVGHKWHGTIQCGPVYGTCEYSMDLLQGLMEKEGAELYDSASWVGAKLQRLQKSREEVFLPYIDMEQSLIVYEDCLEITDEDPDDASCAGNNTCGYSRVFAGGGYRCACCGDTMDEDYSYSTDDGEMCESCYDANYFTCEEYGGVYHVREACTVYRMGRWGRNEYLVCQDARDANYTLCEDGDYWHTDDVLFLADGRCLGGDAHHEAAECVMTNEYYLLDELIPTVGGDYVSKEYYNDHKEEFTMNDEGELEEVKEAA